MWPCILFLGCSGGLYFFFPWFNFGRYIVVIHSWSVGYAVFLDWLIKPLEFILRDSLAKFVSKCVFWNFGTCLCAVMRIYCNLLLCQNFLINYVLLLFFYFERIYNIFWSWTWLRMYLIKLKKKKGKTVVSVDLETSSVEVHIKN